MTRRLTFEAVVIVDRQPRRAVVDGRCCDDALRIGDTFRVVFRHVRPKGLDDYGKMRTAVAERHVELRIKSMMAYNRQWEELDSGMTGRLELEGTGGDLLMEGDFLGSDFSRG